MYKVLIIYEIKFIRIPLHPRKISISNCPIVTHSFCSRLFEAQLSQLALDLEDCNKKIYYQFCPYFSKIQSISRLLIVRLSYTEVKIENICLRQGFFNVQRPMVSVLGISES